MKKKEPSHLNCLFLPINYVQGGLVYREHLQVCIGIFRSVVMLTNIFRSKGVEIKKLNSGCIFYSGSKHNDLYPVLDTPLSILKYLFLAKKIIRQHSIDIIFAHGVKWSGFLAALISRLNRIPLFLFLHSATPERERTFFQRVIHQFSFKRAERVFFVSTGQKTNYRNVYTIPAWDVLGNPVDTNTFYPPATNRQQKDHATVLFAGRPTKEKGFPVLLKLIERVTENRLKLKFEILTDTHLLAENDRQFLEDHCDIASFGHYVGKSQFAEKIREADFLISLSQFESFSYVIAESLSSGRPVIATQCDGPKDFVMERNGLLIPADDIDCAWNALKWMVENYTQFNPDDIRQTITEKYSLEMIREKLTTSLLELDLKK